MKILLFLVPALVALVSVVWYRQGKYDGEQEALELGRRCMVIGPGYAPTECLRNRLTRDQLTTRVPVGTR